MDRLFSFEEKPESRETSQDPPSFTFHYTASGEPSESFVSSYARSGSPSSVSTINGVLYRQDIRVSPAGFALFDVSVTYGQKKKDVGSFNFSFDATGGTEKIKIARRHVASYVPADDPDADVDPTSNDPHKGLIGVDETGQVQGVDIIVPALKLNIEYKHPMGVINIAQVKNIASIIGYVNEDEFLDFEAGELLFIGASGSEGTDAETSVSYQFVASANVTDVQYGDITVEEKLGHHYVWVEPKDGVDDGKAVRNPKFVHVEEVYPTTEFGSVLGFE